MRPRAHDRFTSEVQLDPSSAAAFARNAGDDNPLHHDPEVAARSRFGRLIASGPHTSALLLGLTAKHFSRFGEMLGLEFWLRFRRAVFADERITLEWLVIRVTPNAKLGGDIVELRGRVLGQDGRTALGAKGKVVVF
jgi:3-hydroxybutyryl-CoA dehydratase